MNYRATLSAILAAALSVSMAQAKSICTVIADAADSRVLLKQGDCDTRVTPASTFKIAISLMGFDWGFLKDQHSPVLPYREGYPDWAGPAWREPTDPTRWMKHSVVWFSQQVTGALGEERFEQYVAKFRYGNADVAGDSGKRNGLERAWLGSSLKISPVEQVGFLDKFVNRRLPVSAHAFDMTNGIIEVAHLPNDWEAHGKTGTAFPRQADGAFDRARALGWYVGWARKDGRTLVFARLTQDQKRTPGAAGPRARDAFLKELPTLVESLIR